MNEKKYNVLFVDDSPIRHKIFKDHFKRFHVWNAFTVEQACQLLELEQFEVICLDHDMGEVLNGVDVAKCIKRRDKNLPIVWVHSWNITGAYNIYEVLQEKKIFYRGASFEKGNCERMARLCEHLLFDVGVAEPIEESSSKNIIEE